MKHIGLFEGIGGFSLAARWAGWETEAWCEIDPFCQKVLSYHFPEATGHGDIKTTDFTIYSGRIDILTGGFPCQPYSAAGKRLGKEDERHLWPEMLRAIREIQPTWVVGENVRGLTNWNGGVVFIEVQADLEAIGYEVQSFILPACAVNAPHRRDRVWIVAYSESNNNKRNAGGICGADELKKKKRPEEWVSELGGASDCPTPDPDSDGHKLRRLGENRSTQIESKGNEQQRKRVWENDRGVSEQAVTPDPQQPRRQGADIVTQSARLKPGAWDNWPTVEPTIRSGNDGLSYRLDGITFSKWRNESIKAYGNAIVPQVAYQIFKAINQTSN